MNWYVLFVKTGYEEKLKILIEKKTRNAIPFIPIIEILFKKKGYIKKEMKKLFPGYVFVESDLDNTKFLNTIKNVIYMNNYYLRVLSYDKDIYALKESEVERLKKLCNDEHYIKKSKGIIKGNMVCIQEGPLRGYESQIIKIDRHKRSAIIELEFLGEIRKVSVALDIIKKV